MSQESTRDSKTEPTTTAVTPKPTSSTSTMAPPAGVDEKKTTTPMTEPGADIVPAPPRRLPHLHKLEKKHSSGDLHSRLKTRKLLGVGETDDGDVHRSKLSQILGHSDQLYIRLPQGLRVWQCLLVVMFTIIALWALIFPAHLFDLTFETEEGKHLTLPIRLYGVALLSLSLLHWNTLNSQDRDIIRGSLLSSVIYFSLQTIVSACSYHPARQPYIPIVLFCCRIILITLSSYFYWITGRDHWRSKEARYYR